jgi:hypothetical protein
MQTNKQGGARVNAGRPKKKKTEKSIIMSASVSAENKSTIEIIHGSLTEFIKTTLKNRI